jgi:hypothetical protein
MLTFVILIFSIDSRLHGDIIEQRYNNILLTKKLIMDGIQ